MAELDKAAICRRIAEARQAAGLTQPDLADALEVHWHTVQNWETGVPRKDGTRRWTVPWNYMARIAEFTGVSMTWLVHGEEDQPPSPLLPETQEQLDRIERLLLQALETQAGQDER